jgi:nucleoid-associated protein YgaU
MRTYVIVATLLGVVLVAAVIFYFANTEKSEYESINSRPLTTDAPPKLFELEPTPEAKPIVRPEVAAQPAREPKQEPTHAPEPLEQTGLPTELVPEHKEQPTPVPDDVRQLTPEPEPRPQAATVESSSPYYTVRKGDTLYSISKRVYGEGKYWREIYRANEELITSPKALHLGWKLELPRRDEIEHQE